MSLTFITGVRFYKSVLDTVNHVTFMYDPNWNPDNSTKATLPVCFFHVKNMQEMMASEISQKPMLFYNSNSEQDKSTADSGALNVVADNIVIQPKTYKLDVIVPYQDISLMNQTFVFNAETMQAITSALLKTGGNTSNLSAWSTMSQPAVKAIKDLFKTLLIANQGDSAGAFLDTVMNQPDYNKNSLETMWRLRRIVKIKMWNSWEYKYVAIKNVDITKEGTEDGVYEASITVQEMPIVSIRNEEAGLKPKFRYSSKLIQKQGEMAIKVLDNFEVKHKM